MEKKKKVYTATWTRAENPLFWVTCPHCGETIFMSTPSVMERLEKWVKNFNKKHRGKS